MFFFGAQLFLYSESSVFRILTIDEIALSCYADDIKYFQNFLA